VTGCAAAAQRKKKKKAASRRGSRTAPNSSFPASASGCEGKGKTEMGDCPVVQGREKGGRAEMTLPVIEFSEQRMEKEKAGSATSETRPAIWGSEAVRKGRKKRRMERNIRNHGLSAQLSRAVLDVEEGKADLRSSCLRRKEKKGKGKGSRSSHDRYRSARREGKAGEKTWPSPICRSAEKGKR